MKQNQVILKKNKYIIPILRQPGFYIIAACIILIMIFILFNYPLSNFLFPNVKSDASKSPRFELLKFFAYLVGGVLLIWQIYLTNRRTKASEKTAEAAIKSVDATLKGQVQERFKNAIDQLGNPN